VGTLCAVDLLFVPARAATAWTAPQEPMEVSPPHFVKAPFFRRHLSFAVHSFSLCWLRCITPFELSPISRQGDPSGYRDTPPYQELMADAGDRRRRPTTTTWPRASAGWRGAVLAKPRRPTGTVSLSFR
jgi:hypothetical protein